MFSNFTRTRPAYPQACPLTNIKTLAKIGLHQLSREFTLKTYPATHVREADKTFYRFEVSVDPYGFSAVIRDEFNEHLWTPSIVWRQDLGDTEESRMRCAIEWVKDMIDDRFIVE